MMLDQNRPVACLRKCSNLLLVHIATSFQVRKLCSFKLESDAELESMQEKAVTGHNLSIFIVFLKKSLKVHIKVTGLWIETSQI
jgi:hypothetical protein